MPPSFDCEAVIDYDFTTCGTEAWKLADYRGKLSSTVSGRMCQSWSSRTPHVPTRTEATHPNKGLGDHNFCRNPDNDEEGAWCYTTDPEVRWEYCAVPTCGVDSNAPAATTTATASAITTTTTVTASEGPTVPATTTTTGVEEGPADASETSVTCGTVAMKQADYRGTTSSTAGGTPCQMWSSQTPHVHSRSEATYPAAGLGAHNHCRNPDGNDRAWCYTVDPASRWEFCDVPDCTSPAGAPAPEVDDDGFLFQLDDATYPYDDGTSLYEDDDDSSGSSDGGGFFDNLLDFVCSTFSIFC